MIEAVCDSSALIALLMGEPGGELVGKIVADCVISTVILAEVYGFLARRQLDAGILQATVQQLRLTVEPFTAADALDVGLMFPVTKPAGLSLGDRACLALARRLGVPALTADRAWKPLAPALGVAVELIR